ncbi:hypothetical protein BsWGS_19404 [Bradybaena similaris]
MLWLFLALTLLLVILLAVFFVRSVSASHDTFKKMNIDSPPASRLLGHFGDSLKKGIFTNQMELYNLYKDKKVYGTYDASHPVLNVRDPDMIKEIMVKSFNNFVNRRTFFELDPPFKDMLVTLKDDQWKHVRRIMSRTFTSGQIKRMSKHVERNCLQLMNLLHGKQERNEDIELKSLISHFTLDVIASTGFGLEISSMEIPDNPFAIHAKQSINLSPLLLTLVFFAPWSLTLLRKAGFSTIPRATREYFTKIIDAAIANRKEEGHAGKVNDFLDLLINSEEESGQTEKYVLSRSEMHGQALVFILAGYDTISTVLSFTLFLLAAHPEYCHKVHKEIDGKIGNEPPNYDNVQNLAYMDMCINETMRLYPPAFFIDRVCAEDTTVHGILIPKNMAVSFPVYALHRDPEIWSEPEKFQPERFSAENKDCHHPYAYLPFGNGPRNCVGMRLALMELKIALTYILKVFTPVVCEKTVYPIKLKKLQLIAEDGLWVKFSARK